MRVEKGNKGNNNGYDNDYMHQRDGALIGVSGKGSNGHQHGSGHSGGLPDEEAAAEDDDDEDDGQAAVVYLLAPAPMFTLYHRRLHNFELVSGQAR